MASKKDSFAIKPRILCVFVCVCVFVRVCVCGGVLGTPLAPVSLSPTEFQMASKKDSFAPGFVEIVTNCSE